MGKAVLISVQPKWAHEIIDGRKTVEVRKTKPKIEMPFKCYLYMTAGGYEWQKDPWTTAISPDGTVAKLYNGAQRVIASFDVDKIYTIKDLGSQFVVDGADKAETNGIAKESCLYFDDLKAYAGGRKFLYGWHISNLLIFDEPKELSDFRIPKKCNSCKVSGYENCCPYDEKCIVPAVPSRPPQSWCYVEELK